MFEKIVIGTDGSEEAEHALRLACDIAQKYDSEIHLVHTPQPQTVAFAMGAMAGYHAMTAMPAPEEVRGKTLSFRALGVAAPSSIVAAFAIGLANSRPNGRSLRKAHLINLTYKVGLTPP